MKIIYIYIERERERETIHFPSLEISKSCFKQKLYYLTMYRKYLSLFFNKWRGQGDVKGDTFSILQSKS